MKYEKWFTLFLTKDEDVFAKYTSSEAIRGFPLSFKLNTFSMPE